MFIKGQTSELAWVTFSYIPSPLYLFLKVLPPVYVAMPISKSTGILNNADGVNFKYRDLQLITYAILHAIWTPSPLFARYTQ